MSSKAVSASSTSAATQQPQPAGAKKATAPVSSPVTTASTALAPEDTLLRSINSENEESVYAMDWSRKNPWIFASVSYDGRMLIHQVPHSEQDRILRIDVLDEEENEN